MSARRRLRADPNFIGYTYKNWEAVSPRDGEPCLPAPCSLAACCVGPKRCCRLHLHTSHTAPAHRTMRIASLISRRQLDTKLARMTLDSFIKH